MRCEARGVERKFRLRSIFDLDQFPASIFEIDTRGQLSFSSPLTLLVLELMARRITCPTCGQVFTNAQYKVHKFTHRRDQALQENPIDLPTSRLLPIIVPEEDTIMTEDELQGPTPPTSYNHTLDNNPFSDDYDTSNNAPQDNNPFSDDMAMSNNSTSHATPFINSPHSPLPSVSSDEVMDKNPPPTYSEDDSDQHPASLQSSPDDNLGFEDSGLDPAFTGHLSISEQLQEKFLKDYHSGGELC